MLTLPAIWKKLKKVQKFCYFLKMAGARGKFFVGKLLEIDPGINP